VQIRQAAGQSRELCAVIRKISGRSTQVFDWGLVGVRTGIAMAMETGLIVSLMVAHRLARDRIGESRTFS